MAEPQPTVSDLPLSSSTPQPNPPLIRRLAEHLLTREVVDSLRSHNWTLIGISSPALGVVSDICTIAGPVADRLLAVCAILFLLSAVPMLLGHRVLPGHRWCRHCAVPCVAFFILMISLGSVVGLQQAAGATSQGIIAQQVPAVAAFQTQVLERLFAIDTRTQRMEKEIADLKAINAETNAMVKQLLSERTTPAGPGAEAQVREAVQHIVTGAATGDQQLRQVQDLLKVNRKTEAIALLQTIAAEKLAANDSPGAAIAYRNLGAIAGLSDPQTAREAYAQAARLDPTDPESQIWHGYLESDAGNLPAADAAYNAAILHAPFPGGGWSLYWGHNGLGDVRLARGDLGAAMSEYSQASSIADRLAKAEPDNTEWQRDLSVSDDRVGDVLVAKGNLPDALAAYRDGLAIAARLAKSDPGNLGWQRDLSVSDNKVGDVLVAQGNLPDALAAYRDGLAIRERLAKSDPSNLGWQRNLSVSDDRVGDVLVAQGNLPDALAAYRDGLAIRERLAKSDPGNLGWQRDLAVSDDKVGDVLVAQGNLPDALAAYRDGLAIAARLAKSDPGNLGWQRDLSVSDDRVGGVLVAQGNLPDAMAAYRNSLTIRERLAKSDPANLGWQRDLAISYANMANIQRRLGAENSARDALRQGHAIMLRITQLSPANTAWRQDLRWFSGQLAASTKPTQDVRHR